MKVPYLVFALLSSLAIAQSAVEDDCQCPQVKCRATNDFVSQVSHARKKYARLIPEIGELPLRQRSRAGMQEEVSKLCLGQVEGRLTATMLKTTTDHSTEVHSATARGDRKCACADYLHSKRDITLAHRANPPSSQPHLAGTIPVSPRPAFSRFASCSRMRVRRDDVHHELPGRLSLSVERQEGLLQQVWWCVSRYQHMPSLACSSCTEANSVGPAGSTRGPRL